MARNAFIGVREDTGIRMSEDIIEGPYARAIRDAYVLYISGAAKYKVGGVSECEVEFYDDFDGSVYGTVEFIEGRSSEYIDRRYTDNGRVWCEVWFKDGAVVKRSLG